jgi:hypothetical protein
MPDGIEDEVPGKAQGVLKGNLDENCLCNSKGLIKQLSRMLHVLDDMAENSQVELPISEADFIAIEQLKINVCKIFLLDPFKRTRRDFEACKSSPKS